MPTYKQSHKAAARELRRNMTKEERTLWYDFLSRYSVRFLRQRPIGPYIVDFYAPAHKLVVELDGKQHQKEAAIEYDRIRTEYLKSMGIKVIRFSNSEVNANFLYVCETIRAAAPVLGSPMPNAQKR